jgi:hypothetical protein
MKKTCFAIMPFGKEFDDINEIVFKAARKCGLEYVRGDLCDRSGSILPQIKYEIGRAAVVVADITKNNPNVFYELGIAHQIAGVDRVVIITQEVDGKTAYDVHQFRQLVYAHSEKGRLRLLQDLPIRLQKAMEAGNHEEFWNVIRGRLPRTRILVRDLRRLIDNAGKKGLEGVTIRIAAGLTSLAISEHEPADNRLGKEYLDALLAERDTLREALLRGAKLRAVLNPPRRFTKEMLPARLRVRYQRLIGLLEGRIRRKPKVTAQDVQAMKRCQFALSPVPMPNVFILGETVAYEGMKRGGTGGFEMTHCETNPEALREMIKQFDDFFERSQSETLSAYPTAPDLAKQLQAYYDEAVALENQKK